MATLLRKQSFYSILDALVLFALLLMGLVSCNESDGSSTKVSSFTPAPFRSKTTTTLTQSPFPVDTLTTTTPGTQTAIITTVSIPSLTPTPRLYSLSDQLGPGEYLILDSGVLSLRTKKVTWLSPDDFLGGRLSPDSKRTVGIVKDENQPDHYYYLVKDLTTAEEVRIPLLEHCESIYPTWSPDATKLITVCFNHKIIVQSYPDGKEVSRVRLDDGDNLGRYGIYQVLWSSDSKWIAYIVYDHNPGPTIRDEVVVSNSECLNSVSVCNEAKKRAVKIESSGINLIEWASQDKLIILEQDKNRFLIYDANHNEIVRTIPLPSRFSVRSFGVSQEGNRIFFGQQTADEKGAAIYQVSLTDNKIEQLFYEDGSYGIDIYAFFKK